MNNLVIEDAKIIFPNFKGEPDRFNTQGGKRSFCILFSNERAQELLEEGWNIKFLRPRDEDDLPRGYLSISIRFDVMPPKIVMISGGKKILLDQAKIDILDWAEIDRVDITVRPYNWTVNSSQGVKAYLKTMYVTVHEDEFEERYRDIPVAD